MTLLEAKAIQLAHDTLITELKYRGVVVSEDVLSFTLIFLQVPKEKMRVSQWL